MGVYRDAMAYVDTLIAKGYQPDDIVGFANALIGHAYKAHSAHVTPDGITNEDRLDIIEQALIKLALITGMTELSKHVEATYRVEGIVEKFINVDTDELYNSFGRDVRIGDVTHVDSAFDRYSDMVNLDDMNDEQAVYIRYSPVYDEHYDRPDVKSLRETIAKHMADLKYPDWYFGTTY